MHTRFLPKIHESIGVPTPGIVLFLAGVLLSCAGCAKIAEPQPPRIRIPKAAVDLAARQLADSVVLTVSMPEQNTDGSAVTTLRNVDIFRLAEDAGKSRSPASLSEKQYLEQAVRILSIPESQFPDYLQGKVFVIRDELLLPERSAIYSYSFRYAALFINKRNQAAGLSNRVIIKPIPIPLPPSALSAEVTEYSINLKWTPPSGNMDGSKPARIAGYNIYRSENPKQLPSTPINSEPAQKPTYEDRSFQFDKTYYYAVNLVGNTQNPYAESLLSDICSTVTRDIFPPAPPKNFTAILEGEIVILLWAPSPSADVAGYRIHRIEEGAAAGRQLQSELITALSYRDSGTDGKRRYSIVAVDTHGNESKAIQTAVDEKQD